VIVEIEPESELLQRDLERVLIRNEMEEIRSRSRGPILGEIAELSDVISEEIDRWFHEGDVEDPVATGVPLKGRGHLAGDLDYAERESGIRMESSRKKGDEKEREGKARPTRQFSAQTNSFVLIEEVTTSLLR